jgi:Phosphotransferase enzyme family
MPTRSEGFALPGGTANRGRIRHVGATVLRPRGPYSPAVHALLDHLAASGFRGAPRALQDGADDEVLSYVEGVAANPPFPEWALTDDALHSVATLIRDYHRHAASFDGRRFEWQRPIPAGWQGQLITHNDPHPANVVFRDGRAIGLIDFDLAGPGCVAWELALTACFWAPLLDERDVPDIRAGRAFTRLHLLLDSYGAPPHVRADVVRAARSANQWIAAIIEDAGRAGHPAFAEVWARTAGMYRRADEWLMTRRDALLRAAG